MVRADESEPASGISKVRTELIIDPSRKLLLVTIDYFKPKSIT